MQVLVTGATGRIGANLCKTLIEKGYTVRGLVYPGDPKEAKLKRLDMEICYGDLRDADAVDRAMEGVDYVAHLGYIMGRPKGMTRATEFEINIPGMFNMLEAASKRVDKLERFLFASTNATYDAFHPKYVPMDERHPQQPHSFYGAAKVVGERMLEGYGYEFGLRGSIVRFGTVVAPEEVIHLFTAGYALWPLKSSVNDPTSQIHVRGIENPAEPLEKAMKSPQQPVILRNLEGKSWMQDAVDIRDTVQGIILALTHPNAVGETFNVTAPYGVTWEEAVTYLVSKTGEEPLDLRIPNLWYWCCDNSKAKAMLGYQPEYNIKRMIDTALAAQAGEDTGVLPA